MKFTSLKDLLVTELQDLYSAENQLVKALPKMAKAATSTELKTAIEQHLKETEGQVTRLERCFKHLGTSAKEKKCEAMVGLIDEGDEIAGAGGDNEIRDAGIIAAAQKVEHYEMAGYGCARTWARQLGENAVAQLLQETLDEEKQADTKLNQIAEQQINFQAAP